MIVSDHGPEWVPPDRGGVTRLVEFMDKRGLKSPLTLNALQTLAALGPLLPRDITNLMRVVLRLVQYTLWETDWMAELGGRAGAAGVGLGLSLHGTGIQQLSGKAVGVASPQGQLAKLRPGELIAATDAVVEAFNKLVHKAEPPARDITNLMRVVLRLVQYTLWETDWMAELGGRAGAAGVGLGLSLHGTGIQQLSGKAVGVASPQGQLAKLRPGELIAATDAVVEAFNKLVHKAEPPAPCTDITQGLNESFHSFADRLLAAAEGSDLLEPAQGPVIIDCLQQKSHDNVKALLRAYPSTLNTPGEVIQYVLDKLKVAPLTNEGLARATVVAVGPRQQRSLQQQGLCFRCGQYGHVRAQCPCGGGQSGPPDHRKGLLKGIRGRVCSS